MRSRTASWLLLLGLVLCRPVWADIYTYTAPDGAVSLSNVPSDDRYTVLVPAPTPQAAPAAGPAPAREARYDKVVDDISRAYGLDSALVHAVIAVESSYNPKAVSKKGAAGLMQLMPATAKRYGVADAFDPVQNVSGGAKYLRDLLDMFDSDMSLALAAFNAGEQAVMKYGRRIPPYRETLQYVPRVLEHYRRYRVAAAP
ncbi:MAG: lytic transglycosylase domain-containing protein [Thiobacillus sp.]|uniref:lytic transglycosylase domain-containing protein n=1 Tax=Thiobacillus sp. TaxID=924 RepID=UPI002894D227|nr:lytic transglycosylase domain-containing protein [Thiobacillus sp.]MDT3708194.1 lytic transglycosylase domain-containing protein [Thiobacillus sp.]